MWEESEASLKEPVAESLAASLRAVFADRGIDEVTADIWAHALRGMVRQIVHRSTTAQVCDRFELERQLDLLAGVLIDGLGRALAAQRPAHAPRAFVSAAGTKQARTSALEQFATPSRQEKR
jgi:hypothetical protein